MDIVRNTAFSPVGFSDIHSLEPMIKLFNEPAFIADKQGKVLSVNDSFKSWLKSIAADEASPKLDQLILRTDSNRISSISNGRIRAYVNLAGDEEHYPCWVTNTDNGLFGYRVGTLDTSPGKTDNTSKPQERSAGQLGLRLLLSNEHFGVVLVTGEGVITSTNPYFCRLMNSLREEILGTEFTDLLSAKSRKSHKEWLERVEGDSELQKQSVVRKLTSLQGEEIDVALGASRYKSPDGSAGWLFTITDRTDQQNAINKLKESESKIETFIRNNKDGMAIVDRHKKELVSINPAGCMIFEMTDEEIPVLLNNKSFKDQKHSKLINWLLEIAEHRISDEIHELKGRFNRIKYVKSYHYPLYEDSDRFVAIVYNDVTDEIQTSEVSIQRENQLRIFVKNNPLPIAMLDKRMNYLLVSDKWQESNILPEGVRTFVGKNHYDINPGLPKRFIESHTRALNGESVRSDKDFFVDDNGKGHWLRWETGPWYDSYNEIGGIFLICENITNEVKSQQHLIQQEVRFKSVFESGSVGWLEADIQGTYKYIKDLKANGVTDIDAFLKNLDVSLEFPHFKVLNYNQQIADLFGLKLSDNLKELRLLKMIKDPEEVLKQEIKAIFNGLSSFDMEFCITDRLGTEKYVHLSVNYPETDDYSRVIYGVLDVTGQREQTRQLEESDARYRTIINNNQLGIIYRNRSTKEVMINGAFTEIFGYDQEDILEFSEADIILDEYIERSKQQFRQLRDGEITDYQMELAYHSKAGEVVYTNTAVTGLYDQDGNFYGTVTMVEDVSEKRKIRQKLHDQNEELKKINKELDQFVYSAAHDLRAPIANVLGLIKLMRIEEMTPQITSYVDLQEKSLLKLDDFIRSIVNYSQNSRLELQLAEIDLENVVSDVLDQYRFLDNAQNLDINFKVNQNGPFFSDPKRLNIVLNNLISNAIRYSDPTKTMGYVKVTVESDENGAVFCIEDNGKGIDQSHLEKIFTLFYRADVNSKGTGIGLYLVKETIAKLEGDIQVESELNEWTRFTFNIQNLS